MLEISKPVPRELVDDYAVAVHRLHHLCQALLTTPQRHYRARFERLFAAWLVCDLLRARSRCLGLAAERCDAVYEDGTVVRRYLRRRFPLWLQLGNRLLASVGTYRLLMDGSRMEEAAQILQEAASDVKVLDSELAELEDAILEVITARDRIQAFLGSGEIPEEGDFLRRCTALDAQVRFDLIPTLHRVLPGSVINEWYYGWRDFAGEKSDGRWYWYQAPSDGSHWFAVTLACVLVVWYVVARYASLFFEGGLDPLGYFGVAISAISSVLLSAGAFGKVRESATRLFNSVLVRRALGGKKVRFTAKGVAMGAVAIAAAAILLARFGPDLLATLYKDWADEHRKEGNVAHAREDYNRTLKWNPSRSEALFELARLDEDSNHFEEAERGYLNVWLSTPTRANAQGQARKQQAAVALSHLLTYNADRAEKPFERQSSLEKAQRWLMRSLSCDETYNLFFSKQEALDCRAVSDKPASGYRTAFFVRRHTQLLDIYKRVSDRVDLLPNPTRQVARKQARRLLLLGETLAAAELAEAEKLLSQKQIAWNSQLQAKMPVSAKTLLPERPEKLQSLGAEVVPPADNQQSSKERIAAIMNLSDLAALRVVYKVRLNAMSLEDLDKGRSAPHTIAKERVDGKERERELRQVLAIALIYRRIAKRPDDFEWQGEQRFADCILAKLRDLQPPEALQLSFRQAQVSFDGDSMGLPLLEPASLDNASIEDKFEGQLQQAYEVLRAEGGSSSINLGSALLATIEMDHRASNCASAEVPAGLNAAYWEKVQRQICPNPQPPLRSSTGTNILPNAMICGVRSKLNSRPKGDRIR
ncbi:MAG: hypothetical protein H7Y22_17495 [Gemmatimonadaceae bacterium]|nr:hypothetical protein [Gloeobacterales cyanobacterium ES-bin-141]